MRVVLNGDIVELRSKNCEGAKFTKQNTLDTICWLAVVLNAAGDKFEEEGNVGFAKSVRESAYALHQKLEKYHYYDDVR